MKNFVKALDKNGPAYLVLCEKFPRLSTEKIRLGVFTEPQIGQFFREFGFARRDDKQAVWNAYQHTATVFIIKPTRCTNFPNLLRHETLHVLGSSSVHH
jgi:hypothetical protein